MEFYYSIRGDASKHGTATKSELEQMVKQGTLRPVDLVWDTSNGTSWAPASSIKGLFPEPEPQPEAEKAGLAVKAEKVEVEKTPPPARKKASQKKSPMGAIAAVAVAAGMIFGGITIWKNMKPGGDTGGNDVATVTTSTTSTTQPAPQVDYAARLAQAADLVEEGDLDAAQPIIEEIIQQDDFRAKAFDLTRGMDPLKQWDVRRRQIESLIMQGAVTRGMADDIAAEVTTMGKKEEMKPLLDKVMARPELDGAGALAAVELYSAMKLNSQIYRVMMSFTQLALETNNADNLVAGSRVLAAHGGEEEALAKLTKFITVNAGSASVHMELAGILAASGDAKAAASEVKKAAKIDEALAKQLAQSDSRFDSMRDSWTLKRLLKD